MLKIIKQIKEIMGEHFSSQLKISFFNDECIMFEIYESEIPIIFNKKKDQIYLDCECCDNHLTVDMLQELHDIAKVLRDNIHVLKEI